MMRSSVRFVLTLLILCIGLGGRYLFAGKIDQAQAGRQQASYCKAENGLLHFSWLSDGLLVAAKPLDKRCGHEWPFTAGPPGVSSYEIALYSAHGQPIQKYDVDFPLYTLAFAASQSGALFLKHGTSVDVLNERLKVVHRLKVPADTAAFFSPAPHESVILVEKRLADQEAVIHFLGSNLKNNHPPVSLPIWNYESSVIAPRAVIAPQSPFTCNYSIFWQEPPFRITHMLSEHTCWSPVGAADNEALFVEQAGRKLRIEGPSGKSFIISGLPFGPGAVRVAAVASANPARVVLEERRYPRRWKHLLGISRPYNQFAGIDLALKSVVWKVRGSPRLRVGVSPRGRRVAHWNGSEVVIVPWARGILPRD